MQEDIDGYMKDKEAQAVLRSFDEQLSKYKTYENSLRGQKNSLKAKAPEIRRTLEAVQMLQAKRKAGESMDTRFVLGDTVHATATIEPTDSVNLWLGANVMLEYPIDEAEALLKKNHEQAIANKKQLEEDMGFVRDQITVMEVNMARVYNYDVIKKREEKEKEESK